VEFLGIGYQELLLVLVLLLVVVGPERLPTMAYQIGRAVRTMQGYARAVRNEFRDEIDYIDEQYRTVKGQVDDAQRSLKAENARLSSDLRNVSTEMESAAALATAEPLPALTPAPAEPPPESSEPKPLPMVF
jgi:sec-independent protein translocase protein TatB